MQKMQRLCREAGVSRPAKVLPQVARADGNSGWPSVSPFSKPYRGRLWPGSVVMITGPSSVMATIFSK